MNATRIVTDWAQRCEAFGYWVERAKEILEEIGDLHPEGYERAKERLGVYIRADLLAHFPVSSEKSVYHDLLSFALERVNWASVASEFVMIADMEINEELQWSAIC